MIPENIETPINVCDIPGIFNTDNVPQDHPIFNILTLKNVYHDDDYLHCFRLAKRKFDQVSLEKFSKKNIDSVKCGRLRKRLSILKDTPANRRTRSRDLIFLKITRDYLGTDYSFSPNILAMNYVCSRGGMKKVSEINGVHYFASPHEEIYSRETRGKRGFFNVCDNRNLDLVASEFSPQELERFKFHEETWKKNFDWVEEQINKYHSGDTKSKLLGFNPKEVNMLTYKIRICFLKSIGILDWDVQQVLDKYFDKYIEPDSNYRIPYLKD